MITRFSYALACCACVFAFLSSACHTAPSLESAPGGEDPSFSVLPAPKSMALSGGRMQLPARLSCQLGDSTLRPLVRVLDDEYGMLAHGHVLEAADGAPAACDLTIDRTLGDEAYRLTSDSVVHIAGGSYHAVAMATTTLLQLLRPSPGSGGTIPRGVIDDAPSVPFRAVLIDLGRQWHDVSTLEQLIELARWYKIRYVQLHLTDDQLFTFPTTAFPQLPSPNQHYTVAQLRALDEFARERGVGIIPEIEMPGHASLMVTRRPDLFGFADTSGWHGTINMGRDAAYAAIDTIIGEVADVFHSTPYIHIGGDEASLDRLPADPDVKRFLAAHDLPDVDELYRYFLVRVNDMVRRRGRQMIVWEGFHKQGRIQIPRNVLVMAWETVYQLPQDLLAGGYDIVNASWKPLYVAYEKRWTPEFIYDVWNLWRWQNWVPRMPSYTPIQLDSTPRVIGAMMCAWLQPQYDELPSLRLRLPAMSERSWNGSLHPRRPFAWFTATVAHTDSTLEQLLTPVNVTARGLEFPRRRDGHYGEPFWFDSALVVTLAAPAPLTVRYTLDGSAPTATSPRYDGPVHLAATTAVRARAFGVSGDPVGYDRWIVYQFHPIHPEVTGHLLVPLDSLWEKLDDAAPFTGTVTIRLSSRRPGTIRYTLDGSPPSAASRAYTAPLILTDSAAVRARLFSPGGEPLGEEWAQRFQPAPTSTAAPRRSRS